MNAQALAFLSRYLRTILVQGLRIAGAASGLTPKAIVFRIDNLLVPGRNT